MERGAQAGSWATGWSSKLGFVRWAVSLAGLLRVPAMLRDGAYHLPAKT